MYKNIMVAIDLNDETGAGRSWRRSISRAGSGLSCMSSPSSEILRVAEEAGADLIVVGSHRPAMKDYLLGTNASRVVRHARCSVLVARERP